MRDYNNYFILHETRELNESFEVKSIVTLDKTICLQENILY